MLFHLELTDTLVRCALPFLWLHNTLPGWKYLHNQESPAYKTQSKPSTQDPQLHSTHNSNSDKGMPKAHQVLVTQPFTVTPQNRHSCFKPPGVFKPLLPPFQEFSSGLLQPPASSYSSCQISIKHHLLYDAVLTNQNRLNQAFLGVLCTFHVTSTVAPYPQSITFFPFFTHPLSH